MQFFWLECYSKAFASRIFQIRSSIFTYLWLKYYNVVGRYVPFMFSLNDIGVLYVIFSTAIYLEEIVSFSIFYTHMLILYAP